MQKVLTIASLAGGVRAALLLTSYAIVGVALLMFVRLGYLPRLGSGLLGAGFALNFAVIAANGAMPVSSAALERAGREGLEGGTIVKHELMSPDTRLDLLGDVIPIPPPGGVVLSAGDVVFLAGLSVLVAEVVMGRLTYLEPEAPARGRRGRSR
jgi:hypothetical protein